MQNKNKLLLLAITASSLVACGGGSTDTTMHYSSNPTPTPIPYPDAYSGPIVESYSTSLSSGGTLNTTQNLVFSADSINTTQLYFNVKNITQNVNIKFAIQKISASTSKVNTSNNSSNLPILSPARCDFTQQNESCTLTINLNTSPTGTYSIIPTIESAVESALIPINFTNVMPATYYFGNGTYSVAGTVFTVNSNGVCTGVATIPDGATSVITDTQICTSFEGGGAPICSPVPDFFNKYSVLPQLISGTDSTTNQTYSGTLTALSVAGLYVYQTEPGCGSIWSTFIKK